MLKAESLAKWYPTRSGRLEVLRNVSLELGAGESVAIVGPSGCGKSTFLNILGTLDQPSEGRVTIGRTNPFQLDERELAAFRNSKIGFVFQDHHLLPQCSALENVLLPTLAKPDGGDKTSRAEQLLSRVGLADRLDHHPAELSGGERQRIAIARALIQEPSLVLADEPTGNLDRASAAAIATLLGEITTEGGAALILVTHSEPLAKTADRCFELVNGEFSPR
jgi:lipoprotein-releasing system ATP-binding protein